MNLAPNGKPSNLTPEQYNLVRTSAFKNWFGDWENSPETASKVIDENGEPLVVYRGMSENVSNNYKFDFKTQLMTSHKRFNKFGFYFTDNLATANGYAKAFAENQSFEQAKELYKTEGKQTSYDEIKEKSKNYEVVISYFLNLKNFLNLTPSNPKFPKYKEGQLINFSTDYKFKDTAISLVELLDLLDLKQDYIDYISVVRNINLNDDWANLKTDVFTYFTEFKGGKSYGLKSLAQYLKEKILKKYDGVVFFESMYSPSNIYVAFSSNQVKLADGTNTTFDSKNTDIRFDKGGEINKVTKLMYRDFFTRKFVNNISPNKLNVMRAGAEFSHESRGGDWYEFYAGQKSNFKKEKMGGVGGGKIHKKVISLKNPYYFNSTNSLSESEQTPMLYEKVTKKKFPAIMGTVWAEGKSEKYYSDAEKEIAEKLGKQGYDGVIFIQDGINNDIGKTYIGDIFHFKPELVRFNKGGNLNNFEYSIGGL